MQSDMYPLCPYHAAWNPASPVARLAGGAMPGPTLLVHVAASAGVPGSVPRISAAATMVRRRFVSLAKVLDVQLPVAADRIHLQVVRPRASPEAGVRAGQMRVGGDVKEAAAVRGVGVDEHLQSRARLARREEPVHAPVGPDGECLAVEGSIALPRLVQRPGLAEIIRCELDRERPGIPAHRCRGRLKRRRL